jgi:hypothetical protein
MGWQHFFFSVALRPTAGQASSFLWFLDHTQRRTTVGRTPMDEWSARRRDLCLKTHNKHNTHPCPGRIRNHNLSRRATADLRLRPRGHWDRHWQMNGNIKSSNPNKTRYSITKHENFQDKDVLTYKCAIVGNCSLTCSLFGGNFHFSLQDAGSSVWIPACPNIGRSAVRKLLCTL